MKTQFIGKKKIVKTKLTEEKTPKGGDIIEVVYEDFTIEHLSKIMFEKCVSYESCDETILRDKRIFPVVEDVLSILCEWGIKVGELQYMSALLNRSLDNNSNQALLELLSSWMTKPKSLDDISMITIDRILKSHKQTVSDVVKKV